MVALVADKLKRLVCVGYLCETIIREVAKLSYDHMQSCRLSISYQWTGLAIEIDYWTELFEPNITCML